MTREEFERIINTYMAHVPKHRDGTKSHDAEQRAEIARLREVLMDIVCAWAFIGGCNEVSRMIDKGRLILEKLTSPEVRAWREQEGL